MKRSMLSLLAVLALGAALTGCGKSNKSVDPTAGSGGSTATALARAQVNDQVAANPQLVDEDVYQFDGLTLSTPDGPGGFALIHPLRWRRHITSVDRSFTTEFSDNDSLGRPTMALVTVNKVLKGTLDILAADSAATDTSRISKPLEDHWVRKLLLRRVWIDSAGTNAKWHVVGTSGVNVTSADGATKILSVRIQNGTRDTTITDPLALVRRVRVMRFADSTAVHVTVTANSNDADVFFYRGFERRRATSNGDGTYSIDFRVGDFPGLKHFAVDVLSRGTLHDDTAGYSANAWIFPFAMRDHDCDVEENDDHR